MRGVKDGPGGMALRRKQRMRIEEGQGREWLVLEVDYGTGTHDTFIMACGGERDMARITRGLLQKKEVVEKVPVLISRCAISMWTDLSRHGCRMLAAPYWV